VIERLQGDIDRLRRERQLLTTRLEESEKQTETLKTRNQSLQDRTSNYEQSHEATLRQLSRRERQVEELREELRKEKMRTAQAEAQAAAAISNEEVWRNQAHQAKAIATQKEVEYDTIVDCRKVDYNRHQAGLDKIRSEVGTLLRQKEEDLEKQKKLEIIAEQQQQTIAQLEDLNRKLSTNFKAYRHEIDSAVSDLQQTASRNDQAVNQKLDEMAEVTGRMRWVMNIEDVVHRHHPSPLSSQAEESRNNVASRPHTANEVDGKRSRSPLKLTKHRRKDSTKVAK
jgi:chromosome segregation ATPase